MDKQTREIEVRLEEIERDQAYREKILKEESAEIVKIKGQQVYIENVIEELNKKRKVKEEELNLEKKKADKDQSEIQQFERKRTNLL